MEKHDYKNEMMADIATYIKDNGINLSNYADKDEAHGALYDGMFISDTVTGNASGSYTFNAWRAEENICHNWDLLSEAGEEFGCEAETILSRGAEGADVTIRCYLLSQVLSEYLDEHEDEIGNNNPFNL